MSTVEKTFTKILSGAADKNIAFPDLCTLLLKLGFQRRIKGNHHIFYKEGVEEIINLQPKGNLAKPYQVRQVRAIVLKYKMGV
jgi:predicted RNA binding protein YcfA (HicA-like mRNA interferase family)